MLGFYYSHDGYWSGKGVVRSDMGSKTSMACAKTCLQDCIAFTVRQRCYHYSKDSILINDNKMGEASYKTYVKCPGIDQ